MKNYTDIRDAIFGELYDLAFQDKKTILLSADNGAAIFKKFEENLPGQFFNVGIAEQNAMSVASGLAFAGHHVFVVGIANFVTLRCFEQINVDVATMQRPVTILASGTGYFYGEDGPTHHMVNNLSLLRSIPGLTLWSPSSFEMAAHLVHQAYRLQAPSCIWFDRGPFLSAAAEGDAEFETGIRAVRPGKDIVIVATGIMTGEAVKIAEELESGGLKAGVLDIYRLKPLNKEFLLNEFRAAKRIVTLEEHTLSGGLGGLIAEFMAENEILLPLKSFGIPDTFHYESGKREYFRALDGIDSAQISEKIRQWAKR